MAPKAKAKATKAESATKKDKAASTDAAAKKVTPVKGARGRASATDFFDDDGVDVEIKPGTVSEEVMPSKIDSHPVRTAKTTKGDRVEVKADTLGKGTKRKAAESAKEDAGPSDKAEPKKSRMSKDAADKEDKPAPKKAADKAKKRKSTGDEGDDAAKVEAVEKPKAKRQKKSLLAQAGELLEGGIEAAKKGVKALDDALREEPVGGIDGILAEAEKATPAAADVKATSKKAKAKAGAVAKAATDAVPSTDDVKVAGKKAKGKAKAATEQVASDAAEVVKAAPTVEDVKASAKKGGRKAKAVAEEAAEAVAPSDATVAKAKKGAKKAKATTDEDTDAVVEVAKATKAGAKKAKAATAEATEEATEVAKTATKRGKAKAKEVADAVSETVPSADEVKAKGKKVSKKAKSVLEAADEAIEDTAEAVAASLPTVNSVKKAAKGVKGRASDAAEKVAEAIASVTESVPTIDDVKTAGKKAKGKAGKTLKEKVQDTLDLADQLAPEPAVTPNDFEEFDDDEEEDADVGAMIAGFDDEDDEVSADEGYKTGQKVPKAKIDKKLKTQLKKAEEDEESGVIYVGHIPHGFHEHEMRSYFSQFGEVQKVRLSRSRKTGASKHYAFVEFKHHEVAKIVADTMNNYLMFGHILKCNLVPKEQVHDKLWIGANRRFKKVPWNKIEGRKLELPKSRSAWEEKTKKEAAKRKSKAEQMAAIGYEMPSAELTDVSAVPKQSAPKALEDAMEETEQSVVVAANGDGTVTVTEKVEKKKRAPKRKTPAADAEGGVDVVVEKAQKKTKTTAKKAAKEAEEVVEEVKETVTKATKKARASKGAAK